MRKGETRASRAERGRFGSSAGKRAPNTKTERYSYGIDAEENPFCFKGIVGGKLCFFKVDTGSDVSILNRKLVNFSKERLLLYIRE